MSWHHSAIHYDQCLPPQTVLLEQKYSTNNAELVFPPLLSSTRVELHTVFLFFGSLSILRGCRSVCVCVRVAVHAYMCASCRTTTENITKCHRANILDGEPSSAEYFNGRYLINII